MTVIAAVEGGGTTFVVAIAELSDLSVIERAEFPTTTPEETLGACAAWLKDKEYAALGVACFGPVDLVHYTPESFFCSSFVHISAVS